MINKRFKAGYNKLRNNNLKMHFSFGSVTLMALCIFLLVMATFTQIKMNYHDASVADYVKFEYIPQIPVVLFIGALLSEGWGLAAILCYIIMGLMPFCPIFALGGGPMYVFQYNFGYILGYIFSVVICTKELKNNPSFINFVKAVIYSVLIIHIIGTIYMLAAAFIKHDSLDFIWNWIYSQTIIKILFDIIFSFAAVALARGLKKFLWIIFA